MTIDLHTHSTESDGTFTPEELVDASKNEKIEIVALCDHDTTSGLDRFLAHAKMNGVIAVPGIEISSRIQAKFECHLLGLDIPLHCKEIEDVLLEYRKSRAQRNERIISKLCDLGVSISIEEVKKYSKGASIGRPHIARALYEKGVVSSIDDAFEKYIGNSAPAYVERFRIDPFETIKLLKKNGATTVLAHPGQIDLAAEEMETFISNLTTVGLDALEVFTPHNNDEQIVMFTKMAEKFKLMCSGGSDFHGLNKPGHFLGHYRTDYYIPEVVKNIIKRLE